MGDLPNSRPSPPLKRPHRQTSERAGLTARVDAHSADLCEPSQFGIRFESPQMQSFGPLPARMRGRHFSMRPARVDDCLAAAKCNA